MKAKFVNETYNFERSSNPLKTLGIGKYELITKWLDEMNIRKYRINDDFTINVSDIVILNNKNLFKLPDFIQFNEIKCRFLIDTNNLTSLRGCPKEVQCNFYCVFNSSKFTRYEIENRYECHVTGDIVC